LRDLSEVWVWGAEPDFDEFGAGELDGLHAVAAKRLWGVGVGVEPLREG